MARGSGKREPWCLSATAWSFAAVLATLQLAGTRAQSQVPPPAGPLSAVASDGFNASSIAQFGGSIFLGGAWDWEPQGTAPSRCFEMVDRVAEYNIGSVQFIPTLYWWDQGPKQPWPIGFDPSCSNATLASYYCFSRFNATTVNHWCYSRRDGACAEVADSELASFQTNVGACMKYAASKGLNLAVNARVDDGRSLGGWRNTLDFSPTLKYGKYSYEEAILNPLADMLSAAAAVGSQVEFTLQGEMGATVFFHPQEWIEVIGRIRNHIVTARALDNRAGPVLIGLGANNLKACGCQYVGIVDAYEYLGNLSATFDPSIYPDIPSVKKAYLAADFLGISAYIPMPTPQFQVCQLEGLLERMDQELGLYNMSLGELTTGGTELHYSEYGLGGGTSQNGDRPATTAEESAYTPFFGIGGSYACSKDPFDMCHPDVPNPVRDYRRYYYAKSAEYFQKGGCKYKGVKRAFIWSLGSWDVLAIYPGDRSSEGSWTDPVVVQTINCHNQVAQGNKEGGFCKGMMTSSTSDNAVPAAESV